MSVGKSEGCMTREDLRGLSNRIDDLFDVGRSAEAIELLDTALKASSHDKAYHLFFQGEAAWYLERNRTRQKRLLSEACNEAGDEPFLLKGFGIFLLMNDSERTAIKYFDKVLALDPADSDAMRCKGVAYSSLGRESKAMEWYGKALELNPQDSDALRQTGVSLSKLGKEREALDWYKKALAINEQDYDAMRQMGISLAMLEDYDLAIKCLHLALNVNPDDIESKRNLRLVLKKQSGEGESFFSRIAGRLLRKLLYFWRRLFN
jgi:tetratricopeptide (TPR) repeat protein